MDVLLSSNVKYTLQSASCFESRDKGNGCRKNNRSQKGETRRNDGKHSKGGERNTLHDSFGALVFFSKVCVMKMLRDERIVQFYGSRTEGDVQYLFLEYAEGGELFDRIGSSSPL